MPLRDYQKRVHDLTVMHLQHKPDVKGVVVLPTGSGKSHNIAALAEHHKGSVLIIAHRKELLDQNSQKFNEPVGIYSAGLSRYETDKRITIAGIQSIYNKADLFKPDLIIVDECHLIPNNQEQGTYWQFINNFPDASLIGYTATPYRTGEGKLGWGEIISCVSVDSLTPQYLSPLTYKLPADHIDASKVPVRMGDFVNSKLAETALDKIEASLKAVLAYGKDRKSWMVFCVSVEHTEAMTKLLNENGIKAASVTGSTPDHEREMIIADYKNGAIRCVVNCDVLTTGFDAPNTDFLAILRPTMSTGLHEQICGRGARQAPNKQDCLVCDMAWNTLEHGKLGEIQWGNMASTIMKPKQVGKICPNCETLCRQQDKECMDCGYAFPEPEQKHSVNHATKALTEDDLLIDDWFDVDSMNVNYVVSKRTSIPMMKVEYLCGYQSFDQYVCIGHPPGNFARMKAIEWINKNGIDVKVPYHAEGAQAVKIAMGYKYKQPKRIRVYKKNSKAFPEIKQYEF